MEPIDLTPLVEIVQYSNGSSSYYNMSNLPLECYLTAKFEQSGKSPDLTTTITLNLTGYTRSFTLDPNESYHYARNDAAFILCYEHAHEEQK